ncbi:hypothetical protein [Methylobacterium sp. 1030]|uniref:hypothetical protein n=1 Tax=Methylobacterium sp. 1030 TaxID=3156404 RepID=UPI003392D708
MISYYISDATETAAKIEISKAKSDAGAANRAAGEANERAGKANERAAEALARAEHEALERARLEAQFAWRRIGQAAGKKAIDALSKNPRSINIVVINGYPEVSFYAHQLSAYSKPQGGRLRRASISLVALFRFRRRYGQAETRVNTKP